MRLYKSVLSLIILISFQSIKAGLNEFSFHFQHITIHDGLPQNTINSILEDSYGFMWFATGSGLCRYDGYNTSVFSKPDLPSNLVHALAEAPDNKIWIGTSNGLCYYDLVKENLISINELNSEYQTLNVLSLYADTEGTVWVGTSEDGVFRIQISNEKAIINQYHTGNSILPGNRVNAIIQLKDGRLAFGTSNGICLFNLKRNNLHQWPYQNPDNRNIQSFYETKEGDLWIGTFDGAMVLNIQTGRYISFNPDPYDKRTLIHGNVTSIIQDIAGEIYLGTLGGLEIYQPESQSFFHVPGKGPKVFSLNNEFVKCMMTDEQGNVWIGTERGGVNLFNLHQKPFYYMVHEEDHSNSLSNNIINSIYSNENYLWVGTAGGGLNRYNWGTGDFTHYQYDPGNIHSISSNFITAIFQDEKKQMWIASWGGGLNKMINKNNFKRFTPPVNNPETNYENKFISSLYYDQRGFLFIGTEGGLAILNIKTEEFVNISEAHNGISQIGEIGCLLCDQENFMWIGTRKGLYRFSIKNLELPYNAICPESQITYFNNDPSKPVSKALPGNYIISLFQDQDGTIWIGTYGDGLAKCTKNKNGEFEFEVINKNNGLCNDVIYSIEQDESGFIWLGTDKGLCKYDPVSKNATNYFSEDGLLCDQFYWSASYHAKNGQMFFGGVDGLNYFFPGSFTIYPFESEVRITGLKIFNESVHVGDIRHNRVVIDKSLAQTDRISLSYKENVISIEFAALDYFQPEKIHYKYMLEGVDQTWVEIPSVRRFANYTNLNGGTYLFRVKATNSDGIWSDNEKILTIDIRPPIWQKAWFRVSLVVFIVIIIIFYSHYHSRRLIAQKRKLESMVGERTSQIEEQSIKLKQQADELLEANRSLEHRNELIEGQKMELEQKNREIIHQRDQLVGLNQEVEKINQLRMKFFTNISHEFRTPLTLIISPIESLITDNEIPARIRKSLNTIYKNATRLHLLIDQLLTFRKIETGNLKIYLVQKKIGQFVGDIFHAFDGLASLKSIEYIYLDNTNDCEVWFDTEKLEDIMYNLISNAFKYTPDGGDINCQLELNNTRDKLIISVKDNGIGIIEEERSKIFDRFYRIASKNRGEGSGIGLALVNDLVESLHGKITVKSDTGKGSCFIVELPCRPDFYPDGMLSDKYQPSHMIDIEKKVEVFKASVEERDFLINDSHLESVENKTKILIVEDNKELLSFIKSNLFEEFQVLTALDGKEGIETAKKYSPDLIISDVMMPVMDGTEMCIQLKDNLYTSHIPVILLSAKAMVENFVEGISIGADDYISKPFSIELLRAKVKNLIESRKKLKLLFSTSGDPDFSNPSDSLSSLDDQFLTKAYDLLERNYSNSDFRVETFSESMYVSRSLLYKKLKVLTGLSPNDFITVYRLKKSVSLMKNGSKSINETAYQVGFNDPKYFSRVFKKFYKKTPTEYISG